MYREVNNYRVYDLTFSFPIEKGKSEIKIDCTDNAVLYPADDVSQGVACMGSGTIVTTTFDINNNSSLILTDYIHDTEVSFGTIEITATGSQNVANSIFKNEENLQEFYLWEGISVIILLIFILGNKIFKRLKF